MNDSSSNDFARLVAERGVHLIDSGRWQIHPPAGTSDAFVPFIIPAHSLSCGRWLVGLAGTMQQRHGRALVALLTLDCHRHTWGPVILPTQSCRADGVSWTLRRDNLQLPPQYRIAGTFQSGRFGGSADEQFARIPRIDGMHCVHDFDGHHRDLCWYATTNGQTRAIPSASAEYNDWEVLLQMYAHRIQHASPGGTSHE